MLIGSLRSDFLKSLGERLSEYGFRSKARSQSFLRKYSGGFHEIHVGIVKHKLDFDATIDIAVRINEVEDRVNSIDNLKAAQMVRLDSVTLGVEVGNLMQEGQRRWHIDGVDSSNAALNDIMDAVRLLVFPYFERASSLRGAFEILTSPGVNGSLHSPIHIERLKRVLVLAESLGLVSDIPRLTKEGIDYLSENRNPDLEAFVEFSRNLEHVDK